MSTTIRSFVPRTYADVKRTTADAKPWRSAREVKPHDCEHCGKHMEYADQVCACLARSGPLGWGS
jgi:hypothetical protein